MFYTKKVEICLKIVDFSQDIWKKTLAFYVNRLYTKNHSGAKWSKIPEKDI